ncbi:hypothetical protein LWI28_007831 [Acer negundo]|uniref:CBF1-interacting co-repressor CIR N-terminal domain-containing protein n=1 Tax=Acer negundo TaxID=4023 RepID=A0AAD5IGA4_ACENE|nr:hypothetical protein LWI28_007831 [Acer negundo]
MALKFLNKKGWHTGSLRNIENVWKAEQKHDAEEKKLDELRKQIHEERERAEFRQLQEQAGLVPRQERLDFLYDSGLAVGRSDGGGGGGGGGASAASGSGFQALDQASSAGPATGPAKQQSSAPGALFEDKPHSATDAWRKLHSDPLLLIRQREQEALSRVKNNPIKMSQIRKSVEEKKHKDKSRDKKEHKKKKKKKRRKHSDSEYATSSEEEKPRKSRNHKRLTHEEEFHHNKRSDSVDELSDRRDHKMNHYEDSKYREQSPSGLSESRPARREAQDSRNHKRLSHGEEYHHNKRLDSGDELSDRRDHRKNRYKDSKYGEQSPGGPSESKHARRDALDSTKRNYDRLNHEKYPSEGWRNYDADRTGRENQSYYESNRSDNAAAANRSEPNFRRRNAAPAPKISEEERAARLREMQLNAELHEEQRWKRLRKAEEDDAREATRDGVVSGKNFLEAAKKSVYGAEKGGSSTIEESVRRRTHYLQGRKELNQSLHRRRGANGNSKRSSDHFLALLSSTNLEPNQILSSESNKCSKPTDELVRKENSDTWELKASLEQEENQPAESFEVDLARRSKNFHWFEDYEVSSLAPESFDGVRPRARSLHTVEEFNEMVGKISLSRAGQTGFGGKEDGSLQLHHSKSSSDLSHAAYNSYQEKTQ